MSEWRWITTSEAGVLVVWDRNPGYGWGLKGPAQVPTEVLERYERAVDEFWSASRALSACFPEDA